MQESRMIPLLYSFIDRFQLEFRQHNLIHPAPAVRKNKFRSLNKADHNRPKSQKNTKIGKEIWARL